uniref:Leucine-rich repeat extensin-like protein 5 n=1 Tax=Tanacetum cinerariifolium TaxID=118510 RepID=A0A6L2KAF1_TANCI|nr:hypothetical protein [Tanacetum cinerariifolium]
MVKQQIFIALLPLLLFSTTITTVNSRRGATEFCNPFLETCSDQWPFLSTQTPDQYVVVPSPPPVFTSPSFSPLVASPPPPGYTIAPPFLSFSFSPPAYNNVPGETTLPPIAERNDDQPGFVMSPPADDVFSVPPPPVVDIDDGELPQQQPGSVVLPPPVDASAETKAKVAPVLQAPPAA